MIATPFIGVRLIYGIITFIDMMNNKANAAFVSKDIYKYILSAAPELVVITTYCWIGISTRHMKYARKTSKYTQVVGSDSIVTQPDRVPLAYMPPHEEGLYEQPYNQQYQGQRQPRPEFCC